MTKYPPAVAGLALVHQGKTRDTFAISDPDLLCVVATDRLSTHNVVHESPVPHKGHVLTALTVYWAEGVLRRAKVATHLVAYGRGIYEHLPKGTYPEDLHLRTLIVKKLAMIPVEYILRAYLAGSLYDKYYKAGKENPYGIAIPPGKRLMDAFEEPIFTPTEKSDTDPPMLAASVITQYPNTLEVVRRVYALIRHTLRTRGLDAVDTKFELGFDEAQQIVVADEIMTPDSSRFVRIRDIRSGTMPPWLDKQFFRDAAEKLWNGAAPYPLLFPDWVIDRGSVVYRSLFEETVGMQLDAFQHRHLS